MPSRMTKMNKNILYTDPNKQGLWLLSFVFLNWKITSVPLRECFGIVLDV